ncbi:GerAB/ArcD/ProY family transporter [Bacillus paranthracis]|uniref:GerAB/ArcD/ProY family transporter n=1 Tax=Bacillus paranthracis TaxID=2026186 RepID=UPI000200F85C|nr:GerAB/ArcD/ProY family transporter [Bacillus paranthracis]ADY24999.1 spore germination protein [Bacillus thuringiensis serovar finitimus YBT-020]MRC74942.1 GerAB/ArcD/ProY family transporter [Bacillus thuringiensis]OTX77458.1 spore gernimation protein XA [Bacillus thuringiensis serovar finitimus]MCR6801203.1 spore germination protein [Bacillus paranthracis]MEC3361162.1 GerAB/ArcD/ProY family transporter [Bacillus paranthracis]
MNRMDRNNLTTFQFIVFIHTLQLASGVLVLPSYKEASIQADRWVAVLLGYIGTSVIGVIIIRFLHAHPDKKFHQILVYYFGKWMGTAFIILYGIYFFLVGFTTLLKAIGIVKVWIFPSIPSYQIAVLLIYPFYFLALSGINSLANYSVMVFFFTTGMPLLLIFALRYEFHPLYLFPILGNGLYPVLKTVKETITPFAGLEIAYFLYPYLKNKNRAIQGVLIANTGTMIVYVYVTILCSVYFSSEDLNEIIWPVFEVLKSIHFSFLERLEIIYIAYYLIVFTTTLYPYLYFGVQILDNTFKAISYRQGATYTIIAIVASFIFFDSDTNWKIIFFSFVDNVNIIFFILIPLFFFIYSIYYNFFFERKSS